MPHALPPHTLITVLSDATEGSEEKLSDMFQLRPIEERIYFEDESLTSDGSYSLDSIQDENFNLFSGVGSKDSESVKRALKDCANVNAQSGIMNITVLHIASAQGDENMTAILLKAGADPKAADKLGRTPLHMAASAGSEVCVGLLLAAGAKPNVAYEVNTIRSTKKFDPNQKPREKRESGKTVSLETLGLNLPSPECWGRTPLHQAVQANSPGCVRRLLEAGARVDPTDEYGITPILLAGKGVSLKETEEVGKYEEILDILLEYSADVNVLNENSGKTPLHRAVSLLSVKTVKSLLNHGADSSISSEAGGNRTALHLAAENTTYEIIAVILESKPDDYSRQKLANMTDSIGRTPLHLAAISGCHLCVSVLMSAGADLGALTTSGISALDELLLYLPRPAQCLARIFDSRVRPNAATVDERTFALQLDFRPLAPHGKDRQTGVMRALLEAEAATDEIRRGLLSHPLVEAFIVLKWRRLRLFFYFLISVYVAFAISLSAYVTLIHCDISRSPVILDSIIISRRVLLFSASVVLLNVIGQCSALPKYYLKQFEMWMNLVTGIFSIVVATKSSYDGHPTTSPHTLIINRILNSTDLENRIKPVEVGDDLKDSWVLHVTSVTILLSWAELMLLIGRFPTWGSHALLFYAVFKNVLKVLLAFGCLIIGFSFSFFVQFHKSKPEAFGDPWKAFVKTIVMMMGEFEYLDLFQEEKDSASRGELLVTSRIIFVSFVILASIVLVNLMVGLAVSDTQALRSEGEARRLLKQAEFVSHLERGVSAAISSRWLPQRLMVTLSRRRAIPTLVTVRPSDSAVAPEHRAGHHLSRRLLEDLVTIALRTRSEDRKRNQRDGHMCFVPSTDDSLPRNASLLFTLESISKDVSQIKEILESHYDGDWNPTPAVMRTRKWSSARTPKMRFSNLVTEVTEAQSMLKRMSRKDGSALMKNKP